MKRIAIIGGGIAGMTLAYRLQKEGHSVTVYEKTDRLGGVIDHSYLEGFFFEKGPRTLPLSRSSAIKDLIYELGLEKDIIYSNPLAKWRYLCYQGRLEKVPSSFLEAIKSPLNKGLFKAILKDLFAKKGPKDESIYSFFLRRFGEKIAQQWIDPMIAGIYAGSINELSIVSTLPFFKDLETKYRSLIWGFIRQKKKKREKKDLFTLKGGLSTLINALERRFEGEIKFNAEIKDIKDIESMYDLIYITVGPEETLSILGEEAASYFKHVRSASLAVVNLVFEGERMPFKGFGCLAPSQEKEDFLGIVFDSEIFKEQNVGEEIRLTVMIGGTRGPSCELSDDALKDIALRACFKYLKLSKLRCFGIKRYEKSICQCAPFHKEMIEQLKYKNIIIKGSFITGPSINQRVEKNVATL
jgi:oxygen-dependent protoporphyrinogen oxidase